MLRCTLPCLPPLRVCEEAASRSRVAQCSARPSRRAVLRLHAVGGEGEGKPLDAEARLESLEKRLRSSRGGGGEPAERPLAGLPPKPLPVEPWAKRLEGKSGTQHRQDATARAAASTRVADASAAQRWTPPGCCGWARRACCGGRTRLCVPGVQEGGAGADSRPQAWQTVILVIVGWVVFRIVGPATGLYTLKAGFNDLPGGSII